MEEDSLTDMTGGVAEFFEISQIIRKQKDSETKKKNTNTLWKMINKSFKMGSVCSISIWPKNENSPEAIAYAEQGLVDGHAYTVTGMDEKLKLIRIRNPYGADEWNGDWSDTSNKWKTIDNETKKRLNFVKKNDGEFWMSFQDCVLNYDRISFVHINLNAFTDQQAESNKSHTHWDFKQIFGEWKAKTKVKDYEKHFWSNPQHIINLFDLNEQKQMIVALMSTDYNERRKNEEQYATIVFHVFRVKGNNPNLKIKYQSKDLERIGKSNRYDGEREVTKRFKIKRGIYVIVPSTHDYDVDTKY